MLDVQSDKTLDQHPRELVAQVREVAHGIHGPAEVALRGRRNAHLKLGAGFGTHGIENLNVTLVSQRSNIRHMSIS